jgi:hypothetical protein
MRTVKDIMSIWPTIADMHRDLDISQQTLYSMRRRNSIKQQYWPILIEAARRRGHHEVSAELLMQLHKEALDAGSAQEINRNEDEFLKENIFEISVQPHFSRFRPQREARFATMSQINEHIAALRDEWER